jgi:hypothetical protein
LRAAQNQKDSLSSSIENAGCFSILWKPIAYLLEAGFNLLRSLFCCCGPKTLPTPFEQRGNKERAEEFYKLAFFQFKAPNEAIQSSLSIGTKLLVLTDNLATLFEKSLGVNPEVNQCANVTLRYGDLSHSVLLIPEEREQMLYYMAYSLLYMLSVSEEESQKFGTSIHYLRQSGNRFEHHCAEGSSQSSWAFTKSKARDHFTAAYNELRGQERRSDELFDNGGKLTLQRPSLISPVHLEEIVETLMSLLTQNPDNPQVLFLEGVNKLVFTKKDRGILRSTIASLQPTEGIIRGSYLSVIGKTCLYMKCSSDKTQTIHSDKYGTEQLAREAFTTLFNEKVHGNYQASDLFDTNGNLTLPNLEKE